MFGLMKPQGCSHNRETPTPFRKHYCGTCKVIGRDYGQAARMMLNFDVVFLGELLSALEASNEPWQDRLQPFHCLQLPTEAEPIPASLEFAAAANVLLAELKVDDNVKDSKGIAWRGIRRVFRPAFQKLNEKLASWGFDAQDCWYWIGEQSLREQQGSLDVGQYELSYFAQPTAELTATVFAWGGKYIGRDESTEMLAQLGFLLEP